jgi:hypothetical protein
VSGLDPLRLLPSGKRTTLSKNQYKSITLSGNKANHQKQSSPEIALRLMTLRMMVISNTAQPS